MKNPSKNPDYFLLGIVIALIALGMVILASVSASFSVQKFGSTYYLLRHQLIFGLIPGLILGYLVYRINLSLLKKWSLFLLLGNLILMAMVFLPIVGSGLGGASRWIGLGPISFQPSEFLKITFILYLASWFAARTEGVASFKSSREFNQALIAFLVALGAVALFLVLQPDISTLGIIAFVAALIYFSANTPFWHIILIMLVGAGGLLSLIKLAPYRANRLLVFLNPETDPMGIGYQIKQALIAVGSGGIGGVGLGLSVQKYGFLPQSFADSVFAVFSEETGFIGGFFLIFLFLIFLWRGFKIAKESRDKFARLTAIGITSWIVIQTFVNIGAMTGLLPLTGIPLPFISYGGSALISELIGVGILLNISRK